MFYLQAEGLSKRYGINVLFKDLEISIYKGEKKALVARNGSGKTSLLQILGGLDEPDAGELRVNSDITIGYLPQEPVLPAGRTVLQAVLESDNPVMQAVRSYEEALETGEGLQEAMDQMEAQNAWDYEARVKEILGRLKLLDVKQPVEKLSGGQKKRVALAKLLLSDPDLYILDEPTNHLDVDMIEWLESYLSQKNVTLFLVTHDRFFLDRITTEILELENGKLYSYKGNYTYYLEKKSERHEQVSAQADKARNLLKKELEWARRMPKARTTKSKYRMDAIEGIQETAQQNVGEEQINLQVQTSRLGKKIIELKHVDKSFDEKVIMDDFNYNFRRGERIGIVGENGTGKSTFLNILTKQMEPDAGEIETGETIVFGYYQQEGLKLLEDKKVLEVVTDIAEVIPVGKSTLSASQFLEHFGFAPPKQHVWVSQLSGGEKRRLYLCTVLMKNPNFLILDEPTNDLDILTLQTLEDFLLNFPGCLIVVTHDRYFMNKLVNHLFVFKGDGNIRDFNGTYNAYREQVKQEEEAEQQEKAAKKSQKQPQQPKESATPPAAKRKLSFKEKRELEQLEKEMAKLEEQKKALTLKMNAGGDGHAELQQLAEEIQQIIDALDEKEMRWLELSEFGR